MLTKSRKTKSSKKRVDKTKLVTRIVVLLLAVMMVLGTFAMTIYYGLASQRAVDATPVASTALFEEDQKIRVGLAYNKSVKECTALKSNGGFSFGYLNENNQYTEIWQVTDSSLAVACDSHLSGSGTSYWLDGAQTATVGGYHICLAMSSDASILNDIATINSRLADESLFDGEADIPSGVDYYAFAACIGDKYAILVGDFTSEALASQALVPLLGNYPDAIITGPKTSAVTVVSSSGRVLFDYLAQTDGAAYFAVQSRTNANINYDSYSYNGIFEYRRSNGGLQLVNVLPLEKYVQGVLPYEISSSWPAETQKAFSVTVRNYALNNLGAHSTYDFDICATTCCQVYRGCTKVTQDIIDCVAATEGMVSVYDGEIQRHWYSSSVGGTTVDVSDAWGGRSYPYLEAIATPWEDYASCYRGSWTLQFTPAQLAKNLRSYGYTSLKGDVASLKINSFSENSTYVTSITVTDTLGNKVTIQNSDKIRSALGVYSANFVVGKAGSSVTVTDYGLQGYGAFADSIPQFPSITILSGSGKHTITAASPIWALTQSGKKMLDAAPNLWLRNATSVTRFLSYSGTELPKTQESGLLDFSKLPTVSSKRTITLSGTSGNFVFVGRGWGHGVGSSQYGYYYLAEMGYTWKEIIYFYYNYTDLVHYSELTQ